MYSRYCGAVDNRQPIILTVKQEQEYKKNNPDASNRRLSGGRYPLCGEACELILDT